MTPVWAGTAPLDSSIRGLLTSGSLEAAAAGSSVPVSHTRLTTTGVDELAWAARSCNGFVRAGKRTRERMRINVMKYHECLLFQKTRKQNTTVKCDSWHIFKWCFQVHFVRLASLVSLPSISALCKFTKLVITPFTEELFSSYLLSNKALPA